MSDEIFKYPLDRILEAIGSHKGIGKNMWFSPFREENNASLHVDPVKNLWFDHGSGMGGTNVQLVMMVRHCSAKAAGEYIASLSPTLAQAVAPRTEEKESPIDIRRVKSITSCYLSRYIEGRKIPMELAKEYLKEVVVYNRTKGQHYTLVGFPNNLGGYAMSAPNGFKSTNKAGITTINTQGKVSVQPSSKRVAIFEGFFDFLSWQVLQSSKTPTCDVLVLNSVNNLERARAYIESHDSAMCFLDNDEAGQKCTSAIERMMKGKEVVDMSDLYGRHNDLNEMLQASRGFTAQMHLSPNL